jgi:hypothetical protein
MFQGRGMGRLGGRESAASIPSPCHIITSCCTRFVCLFVRWFFFVWLVVALSLCPLSSLIPIPSHCHATSLLCLISRPRLIVVKPLRCHVLSRLFPPFLLHDVNVNALPCSSSTAWWDCMARCLLGDVYECICFGLVTVFSFSDVPQNSFKIWEKYWYKQ